MSQFRGSLEQQLHEHRAERQEIEHELSRLEIRRCELVLIERGLECGLDGSNPDSDVAEAEPIDRAESAVPSRY